MKMHSQKGYKAGAMKIIASYDWTMSKKNINIIGFKISDNLEQWLKKISEIYNDIK